MVKVSVIVPVYNVEDYLEECLDSIVNQTFKDIEIICINDGSTDNSLKILNDYEIQDNRVKIISQENKGQGSARNKGLSIAKGDYIYFIDSDDYIDLKTIGTLYNNAISNNSEIVVSKIARFNNNSNEINYSVPGFDFEHVFPDEDFNNFNFTYKNIKEYVLNRSYAPWMKLFKKEFLLENNFKFIENLPFEDILFHIQTFLNAKSISFSPNFFYYYRNNPNSTMNTSKNGFNIFKIIDIVENYLNENDFIDEFEDEFDFFKVTQIIYYLISTKSEEYFQKAKTELSKVRLSENHLLYYSLLNKYYLVLESNSFEEYIKKVYDKNFLNLNKQINNLNLSSDENIQFKLFDIDNSFNELNLLINQFFTWDKKLFSDYITTCKKFYSSVINSEFISHPLTKLNYWSENLIVSDLSPQDKIDLLMFAFPLFNKLMSIDTLKPKNYLKILYNLVSKREYVKAIKYSNNLQLKLNETSDSLINRIRNKHIFILFWGLEADIGGLAKVVCDRSNLLLDAGYSITLLNNNPLNNAKFMTDKYHKLGILNKNIDIVNIYDYYSKKNTLSFKYKSVDISSLNEKNMIINEIHNNDESTTLKYHDCSDINECTIDNLIKEELYFSGYLALKKCWENGILKEEYYYTCDGFTYFYVNHINADFILFDRFCDCYISFNNLQEFEDYFVTEFCLKCDEKPFLINDCSGRTPRIENINANIANKVGVVHNNPYLSPYRYGNPMRDIASLSECKSEDAVVLLTEAARKDFIKEFEYDDFVVIPNFITDENIEKSKETFDKEDNVISIYARIAPEKNISDLIKAFDIVLKKHPDAILKIYGRTMFPNEINEKEKLTKLIDELDISHSVYFMGHVNNVFEEMSKSLVTVLCSNIEGFGLVLIESMINSTPVVSYDTNYGPKDIIIDGFNGFIVDQYDIDALAKALIKILDNPENAHKMGENGKQHVLDNFTSDVVLKKWETLFEEIYLKDINDKL